MLDLLLSDKNQDALEDLIVGIEANGTQLGIFIAVCDDIALRTTLIQSYEEALSPQFRYYRLVLDKAEPSISALIRHQVNVDSDLTAGTPAIVSILGSEELSSLRFGNERSAQEIFYGYLQWTREGLRAFPFAIVLWVSYQMLETLSRNAPDFWSWRKDVIRFESQKQTAVPLGNLFPQGILDFPPLAGVVNSLPISDLEAWIASVEENTPQSPLLADIHTQAGQAYAQRLIQGNCLDFKHELSTAIQHLEKGLDLQRDTHFETKIASLLSLGQLTALKGDLKSSAQIWNQAVEEAEATEQTYIKANTLLRIAQKARELGNIQVSEDFSKQALSIYEEIQDYEGIANVLHEIGLLAKQKGRTEDAIETWERALSIYEEMDDKIGRAGILDSLAGVIAQQGDTIQALAVWEEALEVYSQINEPRGKARIFNNMAWFIAQQGDIERALQLWQDALNIQEHIGDIGSKSATLNNMAWFIAQQGDTEYALQLWQDALDIIERIGNINGKAATLSNMARVIAQQGDTERALQLWQDALNIIERTGDVQGRAATLINMASHAGDRSDHAQQLTLNLRAAATLSQAKLYSDLLTVLNNLGCAAENSIAYFAQAIWLVLRIQAPLDKAVSLLNSLSQRVDRSKLKALLGTTALFMCQSRGDNHPDIEQLKKTSINILAGAAIEQGANIESMEDLQTWMQARELIEPTAFLPKLNSHLEAIIGNTWAFDPTPIANQGLAAVSMT